MTTGRWSVKAGSPSLDSVVPLSRIGWQLDVGRSADPSQFAERVRWSPFPLRSALSGYPSLHKVVLRITLKRPSGKFQVPIEPGAGPQFDLRRVSDGTAPLCDVRAARVRLDRPHHA